MCERILPVISNNISHLKNFMQIMRYIYMHWVWSSGGSTVLLGLDLPLFIPWYMDVSKLESTERLCLWGNFTINFTSCQTHNFHVYIYWVVFLTLLRLSIYNYTCLCNNVRIMSRKRYHLVNYVLAKPLWHNRNRSVLFSLLISSDN